MDSLPEPIHLFAKQYPLLSEWFPFLLEAMRFGWEHPYVTVFALLYLCGLGLPLPEEFSLIFGGYLIYCRQAFGESEPGVSPDFPPALLRMIWTACVGILAGDLTVYWLGRRFGKALLAHRYARWVLSKQNADRIQGFYDRWGDRAVFISRFFAGIRVGSFLLAGSSGVRLRTFLTMDGLGTLLSVPVSVWLAHHFGAEIEDVVLWVGRVFHNLIYAVALGALFALWWQIRKSRRPASRA